MLVVGAVGAGAFGVTSAYFTDEATSAQNKFVTGTLKVSVDQSMQTINPVIENWAPGDIEEVRFDVVNEGSLPVNLRSFALGEWFDSSLSAEMVKVVKVEYWDGSAWQVIRQANAGIEGYVYYSPNGYNSSLFELKAGDKEEFKLSVKFDETAGNDYQNKKYKAQLTVEAKQTNAPW